MMGRLHIEMAFQEMFGKWIGGSGWDVKLAEARVLTPGRAHSALGGEKAYLDNTVQRSYSSRDAWCELMKDYPQFQYWNDTPD